MMVRLQQGQIWKTKNEYVRVVELQRLEVKYKAMHELESGAGIHHHVTKKQFCRLIKGATLLSQGQEEFKQPGAPEMRNR